MYLFYVYGSGLGHLNRIVNFIHTKKIPLKKCVIITNSNFHNYLPKPIKVLYKKDSFFQNLLSFNLFIANCIKTYKITTFVVDVFPTGFYGELEKSIFNFDSITTILLARILNNHYFESYPSFTYDIIYTLENGITLTNYKYKKVIPFTLQTKPRITTAIQLINHPFFLIMHSSPLEEILLLYKQSLLYRTNEHIYIFSYVDIPELLVNKEYTTVIKKENVSHVFLENAVKVFTGCGFNTIEETKKYRSKQYIIPFKRKYDNQFRRKELIITL